MNQLNNKQEKNLYSSSKGTTPIMLIVGIAFLAANLRAPLTSIGPLVNLIRANLHISNTLAGMITTLPLFAFALFSPLAPGLARKFGTTLVLLWSVAFLTVGILLRSQSGSFGLFLGTAILGLSISVGNVLIPSLIKKEFPERVGVMTGIYSVSMNIFAAIASGISIPLATELGLGWMGALRIWALLSFISIILWIPQMKRRNRKISIIEETIDLDIATDTLEIHDEIDEITVVQGSVIKKVNLWKSPLAWQVTLYMGLQSMVFYCMVAWLPGILIKQGMDSANAGWMLSLMQLALIPVTFIGSVLAGRKANQRSLVAIGSICVLMGLLGLLLGGARLAFLWIIVLGVGGGLTFSLAMMFFSLRTENSDEAARLSGMAQSIGYMLAAFGPMFFGYLHDMTNNWTMPLIILIGFAGICLLAGLGAARDLHVGSTVNNKGGPEFFISNLD
ncbi:MFS transporter [Desulfosporosinus sp. PR]|uniref:CynX/NimT family MFS transporter n=1 Tax=Candidatus Desulfosporosinus nitrosoreducens TaxID=3401928 RepID=UPI0027F6B077|nr:MFS transporter [Desulfosporosinus sp. PR]MDQ7094396.1 MFS transporter [Desulfosporosinus sp. PR]